jgi:hypothetical protein
MTLGNALCFVVILFFSPERATSLFDYALSGLFYVSFSLRRALPYATDFAPSGRFIFHS